MDDIFIGNIDKISPNPIADKNFGKGKLNLFLSLYTPLYPEEKW